MPNNYISHLKSDIENSRIELRGLVLPISSNQIKVTFIIILPFNLVHLWFFPVSHENWRKRWVDYWGGEVMLPPPFKLLGPCPPPLPFPTPMYALFVAWTIFDILFVILRLVRRPATEECLFLWLPLMMYLEVRYYVLSFPTWCHGLNLELNYVSSGEFSFTFILIKSQSK